MSTRKICRSFRETIFNVTNSIGLILCKILINILTTLRRNLSNPSDSKLIIYLIYHNNVNTT